ncbi:MAG: nuclear transport factor 2 family protein [Gammaproteobacteria bacterium]
MKLRSCLLAAAAAAGLGTTGAALADPIVTDNKVITDDRRVAILQAKIASLNQQVQLITDAKAIERLQQAYGYYVSEGLGGEAAALFSDSPAASIELAQQGAYLGKKRIREFLTHGGEGLKDGEIRESPIMQGVVHVAPDGRTAKGRWRTLIMGGTYGQDGRWSEGPFENEYVKEGGVWKLSKVHWYSTVIGSYDEGWHKKHFPAPGPLADLPPDQPPTVKYDAFPSFYLPPYHYLHPVTGKPVAWE